MRVVEILAEGIKHFEGWHTGSVSFRNHNPGNLRHSPLQLREDAHGYAVFADDETGQRALINDLEAKIGGHSTHVLGPTSTLQDLFDVYAPRADHNEPSQYAAFIAQWISKRSGENFTVESPLSSLL